MGKPAGPKADLWSVGCILYEFFAGKPPFKADTDFSALEKIIQGKLTFPKQFPELAKDLCRALLQVDPEKRMDAAQAKRHEFFHGVDFDMIFQVQAPLSQSASHENYSAISDIKIIPEYFKEPVKPPKHVVIREAKLMKKVGGGVYKEKTVKLMTDGRLEFCDSQDGATLAKVFAIFFFWERGG